MFKDFKIDFANRFGNWFNTNNINGQRQAITEEYTGKGYSSVTIINLHLNVYYDFLKEIKIKAPQLLKHCLETHKLQKIRKEKTKNIIKGVVSAKVNALEKILEKKVLPEMISLYRDDLLTNQTISFPYSITTNFNKYRKEIVHELDNIIKDYNKNTHSFWGRNKDKIIVPIVISILTTLLTLLITKLLGLI